MRISDAQLCDFYNHNSVQAAYLNIYTSDKV